MKLWLLRPKENLGKDDPWDPWYDKPFGYVIRAETEKEARQMAEAERVGDIRVGAWLFTKYSTCVELTAEGPAEVIIEDFAQA